MSEHEYTEGIMGLRVVVLKDGMPMMVDEIVHALNDAQDKIAWLERMLEYGLGPVDLEPNGY